MKFEVIKVSEAHVNWEDKDYEYVGHIPGYVAGFNFECINKEGKIDYMSAHYISKDPTEFIASLSFDYFDMVRMNGFEPTGRVVFRGYGREEWEPTICDMCIVDAHDEAIASLR